MVYTEDVTLMKTYRVLILEDDLLTLSKLMEGLQRLEDSKGIEIAVTVLSEYTQVEEYANKAAQITWDIVLLDRDCKAGGSFHALDITKIGKEKVIGISSMPDYNEQIRQLGVTRIVHKDYRQLDTFVNGVIQQIEQLL